ncbi:HipA domain-containing protein [Agrobacterium sp. 33MFTa1.1]|uniref:HipA domain-containing protein n=1 Tax=Agrobacterium sp. 33MFTa1.1 TaxID=1279031 RepID=UPI001266135D|nr:HipA domain-containing protein [Agrobacterium sp. 33MFTa1.1]
MLGHIGRDTAGALSIGEPRKAGVNLQPVPDEQALERILGELPAKLFWSESAVFPCRLRASRRNCRCLSTGTAIFQFRLMGRHQRILPNTKRLAGSVENEAFCLSLARACGLEAAEATIGVAGKRRYLLVKRYDRFTDPQGEIRRLRIRRIFAS